MIIADLGKYLYDFDEILHAACTSEVRNFSLVTFWSHSVLNVKGHALKSRGLGFLMVSCIFQLFSPEKNFVGGKISDAENCVLQDWSADTPSNSPLTRVINEKGCGVNKFIFLFLGTVDGKESDFVAAQ